MEMMPKYWNNFLGEFLSLQKREENGLCKSKTSALETNIWRDSRIDD